MEGSKVTLSNRRYGRKNLTTRFVWIVGVWAVLIIANIALGNSAFTYKGDEYDQLDVNTLERGRIVEYTNADEF
jgi:hypothetical protein